MLEKPMRKNGKTLVFLRTSKFLTMKKSAPTAETNRSSNSKRRSTERASEQEESLLLRSISKTRKSEIDLSLSFVERSDAAASIASQRLCSLSLSLRASSSSATQQP